MCVCVVNEETSDSCGAVQSDSDRLEKWANKNVTEFTKGESEVLYLGRNDAMHQYKLEADQLAGSFAEKSLRVSWWMSGV